MNWLNKTLLRKFLGTREQDRVAINNSHALREEVERTDPHVDAEHERALELLCQATERSRKLKAMDAQNHYSESLTHSMRGNPA